MEEWTCEMKRTFRKHLADIFFILGQELAPRCRYPWYYDKDPVDVDEVDSENVDEESHHQQKDQETLTAAKYTSLV